MKEIIMEIMKEDNIDMENFTEMSKVSGISCHGAYRKVLATPEELNFDIVEMQNSNEDLLTPHYLTEQDPKPVIDPESDAPITKALRIRFNLKSSSYATMFLREVTRTSSAFSTQ
jgi:tRNA(Glu) U13 pseudouridine synthase TruD